MESGPVSPSEELSPQQKFDRYIAELQTKRRETADAHEAYLKANPPRGPGPHGSEDVFALSVQIEAAVEVGKILGFVPQDTDPLDYLA